MKHFGYHQSQMYFNMRNPSKLKYVFHPTFGNFEIPKHRNSKSIAELHKNYENRKEWEKHLNPCGFRPTITSRFKKEP